MSGEVLGLRVHVPIACFRKPYAREYVETYPIAPLSTVYGMLLSLVGEEKRKAHVGAGLAAGRISEPAVSRVLRTFYRWKDTKDILAPSNRSPDWQELLVGVRLVVWVCDGREKKGPTLRARVAEALESPGAVLRYGALCLGESTHMVDGVWRLDQRPIGAEPDDGALFTLTPTPNGALAMPVWADHVGSEKTRWGQYSLVERQGGGWEPGEEDWTFIAP